MNTYEIESRLSDKADNWQLYNLQAENRELKSHVNELEIKIGHLESVNNNRYHVLEGLLNLIAGHPQFSDLQNELYHMIFKLEK